MASMQRQHDDEISHCGSIAGDSIAWRRKRATCSLRQHSVQSSILAALGPDGSDSKIVRDQQDARTPRFNQSFHHFRFIVVILGGLSSGLMVFLRTNISVAILNMVNQTALYMEEHPNKTIDDFLDEGYSLGGEFDWNNKIQQMIMSWYMVAYTLPQVTATRIGIKIGCRLTAPIALAISAVASILTPVAAYCGWQYVIVLRLINGVGAAPIQSMMLHLIECWVPYDQFSLGLTCAQLVLMIIASSCPLICGYLTSIHWSYAFYVPGIVVLLFCLLWLLLVTDRPDESYLISQKELDLICGCTRNKVDDVCVENNQADDRNGKSANDTEESTTSYNCTWLDVIKSPAFYAYSIIWTLYCNSYAIFGFILPTYLRQYLKIDMVDNGAYCFLIMSGGIIAVMWPHPVLRLLEKTFNLSVIASRRIIYTIVCLMTAATWIFVGIHHNYQLLVVLFINRSFQNANEIIVVYSLMNNYSKAGVGSVAYSMVNTISDLLIVIISPMVGYILDYTGQSDAGWSWIFHSFGVSQLFMLLVYVVLIKPGPLQLKRIKSKSEKVTYVD